jgi:predicted 3-demethylubiquinone-9 3-methyltransferase (glyoxalase superfamily)
MQKIVPHLWFDKEAKEAAASYAKVFPNSNVTNVRTLTGTPSGNVDIVSFDINGYEFQAISAGPHFKITPAISFMVNFDPSMDADAEANLGKIWAALLPGGTVRMPLQAYPFSKKYGWIEDAYGVNWQLILTDPAGGPRPYIIPSLLFVGDASGKAEEAMHFYASVFKNAQASVAARYPAGMEPEKEGTVMFGEMLLEGQWFAAMDSANPGHSFAFNEAVSLIVRCEDQAAVDYYWERLSAIPESERCGWLKDKFGVSWQIVPKAMDEMMTKGTQEQLDRVTRAFLKMKRIDIAALERAYTSRINNA